MRQNVKSDFTPSSWGNEVIAELRKAAVGKYSSLGDAVDKFPETTPDSKISSPVLLLNDWASLCDYDQKLKGCTLVGHFPLYSLSWNPGCIACTYRQKPGMISLYVSVRSEDILNRIYKRLDQAGVLNVRAE